MDFISEKKERLDKFLAESHKKFSRSEWQRLIKGGAVKVNGKLPNKSGLQLKIRDRVSVAEEKILGQEKDFVIEPELDIKLDVIYEDKDIVVVNKPAGLVTHPTLNRRNHTLVNALAAKYPKIIGVGEDPLRPGIVHRLDEDTSGVIVVAKNQKAFEFLKKQFLNHKVEKKYLALALGIPKDKEGTISYQIRPSATNRLKKVAMRKLDTSGKKSVRSAETHYKVMESFGNYSLVEVAPKTGRTHQIRVHLSAIGHPVIGDRLYGGKDPLAKRQMLHATFLKFKLPNGKMAAFEAPLPKDFSSVLKSLKNSNKK